MAELELSNFVQREIISSLAKGAWFYSCVSFFVCTTVDLEKISSWHAVIGGINKIDDGPLFVSPLIVDTAIH